ncbi:putative baseplate assembly protein [Methanosarcina sp. Mfa9]|uniref:putative baseplate assembly protein n=1 Tax=Methanosarcina sp. Mfa9 TaxID=3439063 RepID=UPI003F8521D0
MGTKAPKIDERKASELVELLREMAPHYTPEWPASDENDPGVALLKIFSYMTENVTNRFNRVPHKNFVAFLDMLGVKLLPAQPSRVPLSFTLAKGTEKEILIPARTQAAADKTEEHEELPFETEKDLLAIPSLLKKVVSVDPRKGDGSEGDAIYLPPPGFLDAEKKGETPLEYKIVSSPQEGDPDFQLDHVTGLKAGDFLRIGEGDKKEYVIISGISGMIVTVGDKLTYSHSPDTDVEKVTNFKLFEGKNQQEHSLYLGHKDLFNVKSPAQFILNVRHRNGSESGVTSLKGSWEYWGELEGREGWHKFQTIDRTSGLSTSGEIELHKISEGEIKEREINGVKSRWIRCILEEPLPVNVPGKLPVFDNITLGAKSTGENLLPDQVFNNEAPLDISKPFHPFGKEPRIFDSFAIGSKDDFSKKGANITIDVEVEPRGITGPPAAIEYNGKIKVFARGTCGRLVEVEIDPDGNGESTWPPHVLPPDTEMASGSTPAVLKYCRNKLQNISVFIRAKNGHLVERFYNGNQWQWIDHGTPNPKTGAVIDFDPAAVYGANTIGYQVISVFVVGSDGSLYEFNRKPGIMVGEWIEHPKPFDTAIDSSPHAIYLEVTNDYSIRTIVFLKGENGQLYELDSQKNIDEKIGNLDNWKTDYGSPPDSLITSKPFAQIYKITNDNFTSMGFFARVFVTGLDEQLWLYDTHPSRKKWEPLGQANGEAVAAVPTGWSYPKGYLVPDETAFKPIFIRSSKNELKGDLWEVEIIREVEMIGEEERDKLNVKWIAHSSPPNSKLLHSPFVIQRSESGHEPKYVFSVSDRNSIVERKIDMGSTADVWNEYKDPIETALTPTFSWEYWNSKGWMVLQELRDGTSNFLKSGTITFDLPPDIEESEIAGQKNYWIRVRLVGGDYGKETFAMALTSTQELKMKAFSTTPYVKEPLVQVISTKDTIRPPLIKSLSISYSLETDTPPEKCLAYNNLEYLDHSKACITEDKHFTPFVKLEAEEKTLYLGFEKPFKGGPVRIFFAAKELPFTKEKKPKMEWTYRGKDSWKELSCLDATEALIREELLELIGPFDFAIDPGFGEALYWIKGTLAKGEYENTPLLDGIYPNTTWGLQAETIKDEITGSGNGEAEQAFSLIKFPVLEKQEIRVMEVLSEEEKQKLIEDYGSNAIFLEKDEKGNVMGTWVLWTEVDDFFDSAPDDRHYILDHATGKVRFGDGIKGMVPPAGGNNIRAFTYQAGGGEQGNVKAREIKTLKSAVGGVDKVSNPIVADGGADTATLEQMLEIGPAMLSHRDRAVSEEDFEWLAREASRKIVKVKCLPNTFPAAASDSSNSSNKYRRKAGCVTLIVVPDSKEDKPVPSLELRTKVQKHLEAHCANTLAFSESVYVSGPSYVEIGVKVDIFVTSVDVAFRVESEARKKLKAFFHPLTGGSLGEGWDFGRNVSASDIYALLEGIEGVDHVENLELVSDGNINETTDSDLVEIYQHSLVANGTHTVNVILVGGDKYRESAYS